MLLMIEFVERGDCNSLGCTTDAPRLIAAVSGTSHSLSTSMSSFNNATSVASGASRQAASNPMFAAAPYPSLDVRITVTSAGP